VQKIAQTSVLITEDCVSFIARNSDRHYSVSIKRHARYPANLSVVNDHSSFSVHVFLTFDDL